MDSKMRTPTEELATNITTHTDADKKIKQLDCFFTPIVARFPSLGKVFKTSTSYFFYDTGTGKVIQCSPIMFKILERWEQTCRFESILSDIKYSQNEIITELTELQNTVVNEHILQAVPIERFYVMKNVDGYISNHVNMITLELSEQ